MGWVVILGIAFLMAAGGLLWAFVNTVFMIATSLNIPAIPVVVIALSMLVLALSACIAFVRHHPIN